MTPPPIFFLDKWGSYNSFFINHAGKSNFIIIINKKYQRNMERHQKHFLPNLFLAPVGGSNPAESCPNPFPSPAGQT